MAKTVPTAALWAQTPSVDTLVIKTLGLIHLRLMWSIYPPTKRVRYVTLRGQLVKRGFRLAFDGYSVIDQTEAGETTTHTFNLLSIPCETDFWYILVDTLDPKLATFITPPVAATSRPCPTITKSVRVYRDTAFPNNTNLEIQVPFEVEVSDDYNGWPCAGAVRNLCVDDLSLWVDSFDLTVWNRGTASSITFRLRTQPNNVVVWSESVSFAGNQVKHVIREVNYIPAAGSLSVRMSIQEPILGGGFGWTLSYGGVDSPIYHHNN